MTIIIALAAMSEEVVRVTTVTTAETWAPVAQVVLAQAITSEAVICVPADTVTVTSQRPTIMA